MTTTTEINPAILSALEAASIYYRDALMPAPVGRSRRRAPARTYGKDWRKALRAAWMRASYPRALEHCSGTLQQIRNMRGGFELLESFRASWEG